LAKRQTTATGLILLCKKKNAYKSKTLTGKTIHVSVINILLVLSFFHVHNFFE